MDTNIIRNDKIDRHNVESYHFKVLGSNITPIEEVKEDGIEEFMKEDVPRKKIKEAPIVEPLEQSPLIEDGFVEKLLKKTDELSSENVKLQMKNESMKADFDKELAQSLEKTKTESFEEGYTKAKDEAKEFLSSLQTQYSRSCILLEEKVKALEEFIKKTELELSDTAIEIAKEVVKKEIDENSSKVALSLTHALLKELQNPTKIEIKVNPKDFSVLKENLGENPSLKVTSDEAIAQGGIIILSDSGNLDGSVKRRMDKIVQLMRE